MIGRNFIVKSGKFFSEQTAKKLSENSFRYREIVKKRKYFTQL